MYDLIIIGGGPGGVTAGIYAARQRLNTLLITKSFGGQIGKKAVGIGNYPGFEEIPGPDLIRKFEEHLKSLKINVKMEEVGKVEKNKGRFLVSTKSNKYESHSVIIASGADPRPLEVPGEKEFIGRGVSYCAICDGPLFKDKEVAVIGGGNSGFEAAFFLSNYVKKVYIFEYGTEVKADKENQELIKKTNKIEIITNTAVKEIKGENFVKGIVCEDLKTKKENVLEVEGVFVEIGTQPATSFVKDLVDFNEIDEIKVEFETCQTKTKGLYAVGDANVGKYKQIVTACGEGAKAALSAYEYVQKQSIHPN